jgi:hypothetical protein
VVRAVIVTRYRFIVKTKAERCFVEQGYRAGSFIERVGVLVTRPRTRGFNVLGNFCIVRQEAIPVKTDSMKLVQVPIESLLVWAANCGTPENGVPLELLND